MAVLFRIHALRSSEREGGCVQLAAGIVMVSVFSTNSSNIEWCEAVTSAYAMFSNVVETYNSLSSAVFIVCGAVGLVLSHTQGLDTSFHYTEAMLVMVGAGSVLFHATASLAGELLDELPMSLLAFGYVWQLDGLHWLTRRPWRSAFYAGNVVGVVIAFAAYLVLAQHALFVLLFTGQVVVAAFTTLDAAWALHCSTFWWWSFLVSMLLGKACWELERSLWRNGSCPNANAATHYLHSIWHFASCTAHVCCQLQQRALVVAQRRQFKQH